MEHIKYFDYFVSFYILIEFYPHKCYRTSYLTNQQTLSKLSTNVVSQQTTL
jgi:hypothetical protein